MITPEEFVERLCRIGADRGPRRFPRGGRDREILVKSILMRMDSGRSYSEGEVTDLIDAWKHDVAPAIDTDHVTLRRTLVDLGHLERTADGRSYRVGFPAKSVAFDLEIDDIDLPATVAAFIDDSRRRRRGPRRSE